MDYYGITYSEEYLEHFGVKGMKWGVRRYQNPDGSLTEEGLRKYGRNAKSIQKGLNKLEKSKAEFRRDEKVYGDKTEKYIGGTDRAINQLLKEADRKGYKVNSKEFMRVTDRGEGLVGALILSPLIGAGTITGGLIGHYGFGKKYASQKYKVKANHSAKSQDRPKKTEINLNGEKWIVSSTDPNNEMIKKAIAKGAKIRYI